MFYPPDSVKIRSELKNVPSIIVTRITSKMQLTLFAQTDTDVPPIKIHMSVLCY